MTAKAGRREFGVRMCHALGMRLLAATGLVLVLGCAGTTNPQEKTRQNVENDAQALNRAVADAEAAKERTKSEATQRILRDTEALNRRINNANNAAQRAEAERIARLPIDLSASALTSAFDENEIAANQRYQGKMSKWKDASVKSRSR